MKAFLRTLFFFALPPLAWCTIMTVINLRIEKAEPLPLHRRTLALGDSRVESGIDPRVLKGSDNAALSAEPYMLSYYKLRHITARHRIDTLIVGFAPHNLSDKDHRKFHDNGWATERLMKRMYPLVSISEALRLPLHHRTFARMLFMQYCTLPQDSHITYIGRYVGLGAIFRSDSANAYDRHFAEKDGSVAPISDHGIAWLDSILAIADRQQIEVYLLGVPVHASYMRNIPASYRKRYAELSKQYSPRGVHVVDLMTHFQGDSLFANCDHLNSKGARHLSRELFGIMRPTEADTSGLQ